MTPNNQTPSRITNAQIWAELSVMKDALNDCHVALRGHGGSTGYLTRVELIEDKIARYLNGGIDKLKDDLLEAIKVQGNDIREDFDKRLELLEVNRTNQMKYTIQWPKIITGFVVPILTAVLTAIAVTIVLSRIGL